MIYSDWHFCHSLQMNPHETMEYLDVLFILQEGSLCLRERMAALDKCQRQFKIVRKRRRNFVIFWRGGNKLKRFLAQKVCLQSAASGA